MKWYLNALKINSTAWNGPPFRTQSSVAGWGDGWCWRGRVTAMRTAGVGRGNRHPAVPARSRLLTVCADQGGARRRCMDSPVQLDRVGALRNPPVPLSDAMRRVSPVRLGTTLRLAFPGRSIPPSGNQFRKSRFHAPVLCRATSFRGVFSCSLQRQGQGAGTLWHPQAQANAQFGECRWAGWKAGKLETGTWDLGWKWK